MIAVQRGCSRVGIVASVTLDKVRKVYDNGFVAVHGADIEVVDDPALMANGGDPQLDAAIEVMLQAINDNPYVPATRPADPDRSGMGVTDEDK